MPALSQALAGAQNAGELGVVAANEARSIAGSRQVFFFRLSRALRIEAISGLAQVSRNSPLVVELERSVACLWEAGELALARSFNLGGGEAYEGSPLATYPFKGMVWIPLHNADGSAAGGLLFAREQNWRSDEARALQPIADTVSRELLRFKVGAPSIAARKARKWLGRKQIIVLALIAAGLLAVPVPMAVKAPFQIVSANSVVVSAPLEGVIGEVLVDPGQAVSEGQPLLRFDDLVLHNRIALAREELSLSEARLKRAGQLSFDSAEGRKELGLGMAEVAVKRAELRLAQEQIDRTVVKARSAGVVLLTDKQSLVGKPVSTGERIMEIADPAHIEAAIDLPVQDSIALRRGASVKLFLDSNPFSARSALVEYLSYQAMPLPSGVLAYQLRARLTGDSSAPPKLGVRGTAKIHGETVPLAFYLFRRPISLVRQWLGL